MYLPPQLIVVKSKNYEQCCVWISKSIAVSILKGELLCIVLT